MRSKYVGCMICRTPLFRRDAYTKEATVTCPGCGCKVTYSKISSREYQLTYEGADLPAMTTEQGK